MIALIGSYHKSRKLLSALMEGCKLMAQQNARFVGSQNGSFLPLITIEPRVALADVPLNVKVTNLEANKPISLVSHVKTETGCLFYSYAYYKSDVMGCVDLARHPSIGGHYSGIEPMGLFWSAKVPDDIEEKYTRLNKKNVTSPHVWTVGVFNGHIDEKEVQTSKPITTATIERWYSSEKIERVPLEVGDLRGVMFIPKGPGPHPAVIDLRGGGGGVMEARPSLLACHGFVTLALAYEGVASPDSFGGPPLKLGRFKKAVKYLLSHEKVSQKGVGVLGISSGGSMALAMAGCIPEVACLVAINSSVFALECGVSFQDKVWDPLIWNRELIEVKGDILYFKNALKIPSYDEVEEKILPFYASKAPLLVLNSGDDGTLQLDKHWEIAERKMKSVDKTNYEIVTYPDAGHLIEPPYSPLIPATYFSSAWKAVVHYGGKTKEHAIAQQDSWTKISRFFKTNLSDDSKL